MYAFVCILRSGVSTLHYNLQHMTYSLSVQRSTEPVAVAPAEQLSGNRLRFIELSLVLCVALFGPFLGQLYTFRNPGQQITDSNYRTLSAIVRELSALGVLWYVLFRQGRTWKSFCSRLRWFDTLLGLGLVFGSRLFGIAGYYAFQIAHYSLMHQYLEPKSLTGILDLHISVMTVTFACINPFFEELIVRGYLMTEIMAFGGSRWTAIAVSTALQTSYHLYQGTINVIFAAASFLILSIYYAYSKRLGPVILAHFYVDIYSLHWAT